PWHLPNDLKFFKDQTVGKTVVMGRKTYAGLDYKPLPNRHNIIITRQKSPFESNYDQTDVELTDSIDNILALAEKEDVIIMEDDIIFRIFWHYITELHVTTTKHEFDGDIHFHPNLEYIEAYEVIEGMVDEKNAYPHKFVFYRK